MPKTVPSQEPKSSAQAAAPARVEPVPFRLGTRERRQIHFLVEAASGCRKRLGLREYNTPTERAMTARLLEAVTWALDKLGYPPARYDEVLLEYGTPEAQERRKTRAARKGQTIQPQPADVPEKGWIR